MLLQEACTPEALAEALSPLIDRDEARERQLSLFAALEGRLRQGIAPGESSLAAEAALALINAPGLVPSRA